jgi:hypothetical protein
MPINLSSISGSPPQYAKAWVSFDGNDGSRYDNYNVSSVTRTELGKYDVNFLTPMSSSTYAAVGTGSDPVGSGIVCIQQQFTTRVRVFTERASPAGLVDLDLVSIVVFDR